MYSHFKIHTRNTGKRFSDECRATDALTTHLAEIHDVTERRAIELIECTNKAVWKRWQSSVQGYYPRDLNDVACGNS